MRYKEKFTKKNQSNSVSVNQSSQRVRDTSDTVSASVLSMVSASTTLFQYSFLGPWFGLRVWSAHQSCTAWSAEKPLSDGTSTLISIKSSRLSEVNAVQRSVLIIFMAENVLSTLLLVKGRENSRVSDQISATTYIRTIIPKKQKEL